MGPYPHAQILRCHQNSYPSGVQGAGNSTREHRVRVSERGTIIEGCPWSKGHHQGKKLFEGSLACAVAQTKLPSFFKRERTSFSEGKSFVGSIVILWFHEPLYFCFSQEDFLKPFQSNNYLKNIFYDFYEFWLKTFGTQLSAVTLSELTCRASK